MQRVLGTIVAFSFAAGCGASPAEPTTTQAEPESTDTGAADTTSTTDEPEPEPDDSSETTDAPGESSESSEDTGDGWTPYQACEMNACPEEADECHTYVAHVPVHYCTVHCEEDSDCPPPPSGQTVPRCDAYISHGYCALDCESAFCPSGMGCWDVTLVDETEVKRCGWIDE